MGLKKYFDLVICAKDKTEIKPKPLILIKVLKKLKIGRQEALYAGDMAIDVLAGKNAGIKTIAVLGGSSSRAQLKQARPFKLISNLSGLLSFLKV